MTLVAAVSKRRVGLRHVLYDIGIQRLGVWLSTAKGEADGNPGQGARQLQADIRSHHGLLLPCKKRSHYLLQGVWSYSRWTSMQFEHSAYFIAVNDAPVAKKDC